MSVAELAGSRGSMIDGWPPPSPSTSKLTERAQEIGYLPAWWFDGSSAYVILLAFTIQSIYESIESFIVCAAVHSPNMLSYVQVLTCRLGIGVHYSPRARFTGQKLEFHPLSSLN